jgi:hypothetical protein
MHSLDKRKIIQLMPALKVRDVSMYKMAIAGVPSGTILAVHLQKCLHLSNEIRMMQQK